MVFHSVASAASAVSHCCQFSIGLALLAFLVACEPGDTGATGRGSWDATPPSVALTGIDLSRPSALDCAGAPCSAELSGQLNPADPARQRIVVRGSTRGASSTRAPASCVGLGAEVSYGLDLSAFAEPVRLALGSSASFDSSLRIERGGPEDPALLACNADATSGVDDAFLSVTLEPDRYRLVVDGETADDAGDFELWLELSSRDGRCRAAPANDRCERPMRLDPNRPRQVLFGTTECSTDQAQPLWECGNFVDRRGEVFYELDLSARSEAVLLHASTQPEPAGADVLLYVLRAVGDECAETLLCNEELSVPGAPAELWAPLAPGRYLLAVESRAARASDFGLLVELGDACVVSNDTCATAQALEPSLGTQRLTAWPMCGDDSLSSSCQRAGPSPDVFYRLDLSAFTQPVHVSASTSLAGHPLASLLLLGEHDGTCAGELWCGDFDLWLPPAVYFLALDAFRDQQGPVELSVTLSTDEAPAAASCIDATVAQCARQFDCCDGAGDSCWLAFRSCGLEPEALDCLCAADPACCGGAGTSYDCAPLLEECGTFCEGFDPASTCP